MFSGEKKSRFFFSFAQEKRLIKTGRMRTFESKDRDATEKHPLCSGVLVETGEVDDIIAAVRKRNVPVGVFPAPYLMLDLCMPKDIEFTEGASPPGGEEMIKLVMPCSFIADLVGISNDSILGMSVVKCNAAVPVYHWFNAANLLLNFFGQKGKVIPFPMDQEAAEGQEKMTVYHMLRVTPYEYGEYAKVLQFGMSCEGVQKGFLTAARFAYEVLNKRGITDLTAKEVDTLISHVMIKTPSRIECVMASCLRSEDIDREELEKAYIFYI
jgi:hypothetical protein